ncbi:hypothetical protein Q5P01_013583 [Channa striata]|uniref:Uncharacterized protein n=1 Tax=Channa striata TaxID=64152 RepID=A0AA88MJM6_CHASR|nr:hypothetical protein Q5P01_013583 [Channa striata]
MSEHTESVLRLILLLVVQQTEVESRSEGNDWWLACWASEQKHTNVTEHLNGSFLRQLDLDLYLGVYAGLAAALVMFGFLCSLLFFKVLVSSAQTLHTNVFNGILKTPLHLFLSNLLEESSAGF